MSRIKIKGLKEVQAKLNATSKNLEKKVDAVIGKNVQEMARNAKRDAPKDYGTLAKEISASRVESMRWTLVSQAFYSAYLEFGTKGNYRPIPGVDASEFKGKGGSGKGFFDQILAWVKRKGLAGTYSTGIKKRKGGGFEMGGSKGRRTGKKEDRQREDEQVAWMIFMSIKKKGIKAQPYFHKQADIQEPTLNKDIEQVINSINEQRL